VPVAIIVAVLLLLAAEGVVRAGAHKLPRINQWGDWEVANKVAAIDQLAKKGGASVVVTGSSDINAGVDPLLLSLRLGGTRPVFNAALDGAGARTLNFWMTNIVVPRLHPDVVVIGLTSRDLNDLGSAANQIWDLVRFSPASIRAFGGGSLASRLDAELSNVSYLARYRNVLRHPFSTIGKKDKAELQQSVTLLGRPKRMRYLSKIVYSGITPDFLRRVAPMSFTKFSIGGGELTGLRRMIATLQQRKIKVVLVKMPIIPVLISIHPHGIADYDAFGRALASVVDSTGVRFFDATPYFKNPAEFRDPYHLNDAGVARFTPLLDDLVRGTSPPSP